MVVAQEALRARRSVAIFNGPDLLNEIRMTYDDNATTNYKALMKQLRGVDLLYVDDIAVARPTEWVLEQLYTIVNDRYQDERSIVLTADVASPETLRQHVGKRTFSRLHEMCADYIVPIFGSDRRLHVS